jgi:RHS repeat-associated protein
MAGSQKSERVGTADRDGSALAVSSASPVTGPLPALGVPKGGGAIRGVGERFSVNPANGAGSTEVALPMPPGRAGFEMALKLSYATSAANGPFGAGWTLSVPSVARKTDKQLPRYDEADTFVLSGPGDLVLVGPAPHAPPGSERAGYDIERYRPRVEREFRRIERWSRREDGQVHFRVTDRNDVVQIFGATAQARIAFPHEPSRVFRWLLEEVRDGRGNVAVYEYAAEDGSLVDRSLLHERNRHPDDLAAQRYLKRVSYGNRRPHEAGDWMFQIVFDYGDHDDAAPSSAPDRPWTVRADPFSEHRAGFELRTYRLCRRVLVFHHFAELGPAPVLARSMRLSYDGSPVLAKLVTVAVRGHGAAAEHDAELPPLELEYSPATLHHAIRYADATTLAGIPAGAPSVEASWVDLDAEGIPGVLSRHEGAWLYKANRGGGELEPPRLLAHLPAGGGGTQQLLDLGGDGSVEWVAYGPPLPGYFARTEGGDFEPFVAFREVPNIDFADPNLRFVDLDGDGHADVLISEDDVFVWYRSRARVGFEAPQRVAKAVDEELGPRVVFTNPDESVQLADMSGDGLLDLVRIRNGSVVYWPNLGFGRFGKKIEMSNPPRFAAADGFDPRRLLLGDIDGSGTTDLVYLAADAAVVFLNQAGNAFAEPERVETLPSADGFSNVSLVDLFGKGTACLVWTSPLPSHEARPLAYVDLMREQKPHLLVRQRNNLGAETMVRYAPSTKFYLDDKHAGRPWLTRLPFPVHVVERVEQYDGVRRARFVTEYRYRHGYFDPEEREFRGFALVEARDAESFDPHRGRGLFDQPVDNEAEEHRLPPVLTKSWFHTGAWLHRERFERALAREYFRDELLLSDGELPAPPPAHRTKTERELARALAGAPLRREIYAEDASDRAAIPYVVEEQSHGLRLLHAADAERDAVVALLPGHKVEAHYERNADDPRVVATFTLEVDGFGNVRRGAKVALPRRRAAREAPGNPAVLEQGTARVTVQEASFINRDGELDWYRVGAPHEEKLWELGIDLAAETLPDPADLDRAFLDAREASFLSEARPGERRLLRQTTTVYRSDDQTRSLAGGEIERLGLVDETYRLALPVGILETLLEGAAVDERRRLLSERGGYVERGGAWWVPSGRATYDAARFFLPTLHRDPFGATWTAIYDDHALFASETIDPLASRTRAVHDYRALSPTRLTDPNDNVTAVAYDGLGRATAIAFSGKVSNDGSIVEGDTLADPSVRFIHRMDTWRAGGGPSHVVSETREAHGVRDARKLLRIAYSDGSGNVVMEKAQAEPGSAYVVRDGVVVLDAERAPRWIGTGRVVLDNKGNPVKQYEPYFSRTPDYEPEAALAEIGVSPIHRYDPTGRKIATELPDGTVTQQHFDAWTQTQLDANDLVRGSRWEREVLDSGTPEARRARELALAHADSPARVHLDPLGRPVVTVADNRERGLLVSRAGLDVAGKPRSLTDARGVVYARQDFDALGRRYRIDSVDAGVRRALLDVADQPILEVTPRGHVLETRYDRLRRAVSREIVRGADRRTIVRSVFGEDHPEATSRNLRGQLFRAYDGAGVLTHERYDFRGKLAARTRALVAATAPFDADILQAADWTVLPAPTVPEPLASDAVPAGVDALLDSQPPLRESTDHDALGRPVTTRTADGTVIRRRYNEATLLEAIDIESPGGPARPLIRNIDYDVRGQRTRVEQGDATADGRAFVTTERTYDPNTFRLVQLITTRPDGVTLQDLRYTYDPVGNITAIEDRARHDAIKGRNLVSADRRFAYDAVYQLTYAEGRVGPRGAAGPDDPDVRDIFAADPGDAQALRRYTETYRYDPAGNLELREHRVFVGAGSRYGWDQHLAVEDGAAPGRPGVRSNRLVSTQIGTEGTPGARQTYAHDVEGNLLSMPHIAALRWTPTGQLGALERTATFRAVYAYDASGERVRKVVDRDGVVHEHIYFGACEIFRERVRGALEQERQTVHVDDEGRRTALLERQTVRGGARIDGEPRIRIQLGDHLESVAFEVTERGAMISYEEYLPFGETAVHAADLEVSRRRYRYTGKEKDEESGLAYHSARYYAPWLGRWVSADPAEFVDGGNVYRYCSGAPTRLSDPTGCEGSPIPFIPPIGPWNWIDPIIRRWLGPPPSTQPPPQRERRRIPTAAERAEDAYVRAAVHGGERVYVRTTRGGWVDSGHNFDRWAIAALQAIEAGDREHSPQHNAIPQQRYDSLVDETDRRGEGGRYSRSERRAIGIVFDLSYRIEASQPGPTSGFHAEDLTSNRVGIEIGVRFYRSLTREQALEEVVDARGNRRRIRPAELIARYQSQYEQAVREVIHELQPTEHQTSKPAALYLDREYDVHQDDVEDPVPYLEQNPRRENPR